MKPALMVAALAERRVPKKQSLGAEFEEPSGGGDRIVDSRKPETMPGHRVIAGGDRRADQPLEPCDRLGDAQAGALD